jgi:hypothetical protein
VVRLQIGIWCTPESWIGGWAAQFSLFGKKLKWMLEVLCRVCLLDTSSLSEGLLLDAAPIATNERLLLIEDLQSF